MKLNHSRSLNILMALSVVNTASQTSAINASLIGFTATTQSYVADEFEGADFGKTVKLDNGMVFEFNTYHYTYSYRPKASVYEKTSSVMEPKKLGIKNPTQPITLYKLLIKDYVYDVFRLR